MGVGAGCRGCMGVGWGCVACWRWMSPVDIIREAMRNGQGLKGANVMDKYEKIGEKKRSVLPPAACCYDSFGVL